MFKVKSETKHYNLTGDIFPCIVVLGGFACWCSPWVDVVHCSIAPVLNQYTYYSRYKLYNKYKHSSRHDVRLYRKVPCIISNT